MYFDSIGIFPLETIFPFTTICITIFSRMIIALAAEEFCSICVISINYLCCATQHHRSLFHRSCIAFRAFLFKLRKSEWIKNVLQLHWMQIIHVCILSSFCAASALVLTVLNENVESFFSLFCLYQTFSKQGKML